MAFMVPVVKKDYEIYSRSPLSKSPSGKLSVSSSQLKRQQSHSITFGVLNQQNQKQTNNNQSNERRNHSKSVNHADNLMISAVIPINTPSGALTRDQLFQQQRQRKVSGTSRTRTGSNSNSVSSNDSLETVRNMMCFQPTSTIQEVITPDVHKGGKQRTSSNVSNSSSSQHSAFKQLWSFNIFKTKKSEKSCPKQPQTPGIIISA